MYIILKYFILLILIILIHVMFYQTLARFILTTECVWLLVLFISAISGSYTFDSDMVSIALIVLVIAAAEMVLFSLSFIIFKK